MCAAAALRFWRSHDGQVHAEWHDGRPHIETRVPPTWQATSAKLAPELVAVRNTGTARGNGAFTQLSIPSGAYLCDYEGELLDLDRYYHRYPTGIVRTSCVRMRM